MAPCNNDDPACGSSAPPRSPTARAERGACTAPSTLPRRQATQELARFVEEVQSLPAPAPRADARITFASAVDRFLDEHLREEKGRDERTIRDYRRLHNKWFNPTLGSKQLREVSRADLDAVFGKMRSAGLSRSRLNQGRSLYHPLFRWARSRSLVYSNPMEGFELPTSRHVSSERTPPEIEELCLLLREAVVVTPDVAPILALGAVTGMRRGELVALRRSRINRSTSRITVDSAVDGARVTTTKTRKQRTVHVDVATLALLDRVCAEQDALAAESGAELVSDPFVFTLTIDGSRPMSPDFVTTRVAKLKEHLGIEQKSAAVVAREDEALRLRRLPPQPRPAAKTGPAPGGGLSFAEIGAQFGRSERWAASAVASALRREAARAVGDQRDFDGSNLALRKFTSSELLDAGFNISMVAQRQGHGTQVLTKHYAKARRSADQKAAEHLGRLVHGAD